MVSVQVAALVVALASAGETVLLDFQAPWCAPCRSMDGMVSELQQAGYPVRKVNVDHERGLATKHNVQSIPCFVLLVNGEEAGRITGAARRSELLALFDRARVQRGDAPQVVARGQSPDPPSSVAMRKEVERDPFVLSQKRGVDPAASQGFRGAATAVNPQDLIAASVRLAIADDQGISHGSGTLIDSRHGEALVLTCGHIFRDAKGKGKITVDLCGPQGPQNLPGRLVGYDLDCDIGLVSIRPGVPVSVAPVATKGYRANKGDQVISVGCNNGGQATALTSNITAIDKFLGAPNLQVAGLPVQGRSGGGLFSADGQVIGVCNAADPADNEGLYAALASIHGQLDRVGLSAVYEGRPTQPAARLASNSGVPDMPVRMPNAKFAARGAGSAGPGGDGAEVICIVRSLTDPQAKSEVIKLDRASLAFLSQLAADREAQQARHLTSLEVRTPPVENRPAGGSQAR